MNNITVLSDTKQKIRYVYHLSDIHIRSPERNDEYINVFNCLYNHLSKALSGSIIVITGDVMHLKTFLMPESVRMAHELFSSLANYAPVIVIPGNHDFNMANRSRLDALSPILINICESKNVFYLRDSGYYQYNNLLFGVSSIFDDMLLKAPIKKEHISIALYHGSIRNITMDDGTLFRDEIAKYDYGMLGDIHAHSFVNENKTIGYAGSLIQQSFGETIDGHGFIKWDLMSGSAVHIDIKNDYCFATINIVNGEITSDISNLSKKIRVRFTTTETTESQLRSIIDHLKQSHDIIEMKVISSLVTKTKRIESQTSTIQDSAFANHLSDYAPETAEELKKLHESIYKTVMHDKKDSISDASHSNSQKWSIIELRFSNMLCYGKDNIIEFDKYEPNKIIGIVAPNHYGKSAILDIILFVLFDRFSRGERRDILNKKKNTLQCSIVFKIGDQKYKIERKGTRSTSKVSVTIDVKFIKYDIDTDEEINLSGIDKNDTNRKICELVGNYDDYLVTCFCLQENHRTNFIEMTKLQKKDYLNDILKLNAYSFCHKYAKEKLKELNTELSIYSKDINNKTMTEMTDQALSLTKEIDLLSKQIELNAKIIHMYCPFIDGNKYNYESIIKAENDLLLQKQLYTGKDINELKMELERLESEYLNWLEDNNISAVESEINALFTQLIKIVPVSSVIDERDKWRQRIAEIDNTFNDMLDENNLLEQKKALESELLKMKRSVIGGLSFNDSIKTDVWDLDQIITKELSLISESKDRIQGHIEMINDFIEASQEDVLIERYRLLKKQKQDLLRGIEGCNLKDHLIAFEKSLRKLKRDIDDNINYINDIATQALIKTTETELRDVNEDLERIAASKAAQSEKVLLMEKISLTTEKITLYETHISSVAHNQIINNKIDILKAKLIELRKKELDYKTQKSDLESMITKMMAIDKLIDDNNINKGKCVLNESFMQLDESMRKMRDRLMNENSLLEKQRMSKVTLLTLTKKDISDYIATYQKHDELTKQNNLYQSYIKMVGPDGLPYTILKTYLPLIEKDVNKVLGTMVSFEIEIVFHDVLKANDHAVKNIKANIGCVDVNIRYPNSNPYNVSLASGFEKFIINLAIRLVLGNISMSSKPNFFIIDEGWSCMDTENKNNIPAIMDYLKSQFDHIIIISHLEELKNQSEYTINIERANGLSKVTNAMMVYD